MREAARLFGAADAVRRAVGVARFKINDEAYATAVEAVREALGHSYFENARVEGAAMSTLEAMAYARRGHGDRKRPASGWRAPTPTELDVVRLVREGLACNDIATRLFPLGAHRAEPSHPRPQQARHQLAGSTRARSCPARLKTLRSYTNR